MNKLNLFSILVPLIGAVPTVQAAAAEKALVVTASNDSTTNQLLVYDSGGKWIQTLSTKGKGGVAGNAGGIGTKGNLVAVVNYLSNSVSMFERSGNGFVRTQVVTTTPGPVSVAFGADHLYILGTTKVESHRMYGSDVNSNPDGVVTLLIADGSSAQVGFVKSQPVNQLIISEKSGAIETVNLLPDGAVSGVATLVQNIPANPMAPFGLVTRGDDAYVTIAHSDEISLVRNGKVLTTTIPQSGTHTPCWLALTGPFLFASDTGGKIVSRYAVYGQKIVQDALVAASISGGPTDIASGEGLVAVIDSGHLSIFSVDEDGNLTPKATVTISGANGVAVVRGED